MTSRLPVPNAPPPEAVSPQEVYQVICDAASQDPQKIKTSSERLKEMFSLAGTSDALSEIAVQHSLPLQVRQQSIIQLKNSALNHWRSRRLISEEDRSRIRARCLMLINEPDPLIAECNELITAKIARHDFPIQWPNLIDDLTTVIQGNILAWSSGAPFDFLALRRSLELMNAIIKELAGTRLLTGVKNMAKVVELQHIALQNHYSTVIPAVTALTPNTISTPRAAETVLLAHLIFKCLVKCAIWLWQRMKDPQDRARVEPWLSELFRSSAVQVQALTELKINLVLALRSGQATSNQFSQHAITDFHRHIYLFGKYFRRLQQIDSARFVKQPLCGDLVMFYWNKVLQATSGPPELISDSPTAVFPTRWLVQGMVLFKESLSQWGSARKDGITDDQFISKEFVVGAVTLLVTHFIPLKPSDLEEWIADPEEWVNIEERGNEHWEYELRPCAERVLIVLSNHCRNYVEPLLQHTWKQVRSKASDDLPSILQKEALYTALGRCAHRMMDRIPFNDWLETDLVAEARSTNPSFPIIKRRIAWLIGKWISSESSSPNNPTLWQVLVHLLQDRGPGTDAVVRLTAAMAIRECVDTTEFNKDVFAPFLSVVVPELLRLVAEVDTLESKRRILSSLNSVIERVETQITPLMNSIAEPIPQLWVKAGEDWLFKSCLLETVTHLIGSSKEHSTSLSPLVVPLVQDSFTPAAKIQLEEDAMNLWLAALRNTTTIDNVNGGQGLFVLLPNAISVLAVNLDLLYTVTKIAESYFLLDPIRILQVCSSDLFQAFKASVEHAISVNAQTELVAIGLLIQLAPSNLWGEALHTSGLFAYIVKALIDDKADSSLLMGYVLLLARIALTDKHMFVQLMSATPSVLCLPETELWEGILNQWWNRFDNMYKPQDRKLSALGIASLVSTGRHEVLDRVSTEVTNLWLDVLGEIKEAQERAAEADEDSGQLTLYWDQSPEDLFEECINTPEFNRRKIAFDNDPVRTTQLTTYITAQFQQAEMAIGGAAVLQSKYLAKADPIVIERLQKELANSS